MDSRKQTDVLRKVGEIFRELELIEAISSENSGVPKLPFELELTRARLLNFREYFARIPITEQTAILKFATTSEAQESVVIDMNFDLAILRYEIELALKTGKLAYNLDENAHLAGSLNKVLCNLRAILWDLNHPI